MTKESIFKLEKVTFAVCSFFIYSLVGWIYEVIAMYSAGFGFVNRGFLYGCYLPIYGFAGLLFILILIPFKKTKVNIGKIPITPIIIFVIVVLVSTIIEYVIYCVLEKYFNLILWDYSDYKYNLDGKIALASSCLFGLIGLLMFYIIQPLLEKIRKNIKPKIITVTALIISVIMAADLIITLITKY